MSGGKKKSGFQITSVTTDYSQASVESQKSSFPSDSSGPPLQAQQPPVGKALTNGGQNMAHSPSLTSRQPGHAQSGSLGRVGIEGGAGTGESRAPSSGPATFSSGAITTAGLVGVGEGRSEGRLPNGPALLDAARAVHHHASSSQPGTPVTTRKQVSTDHVGAHSSRFRVVRLGQGLGEPYRRGRWTCVDFLEREGGEERGLRRVMDSMRHAHSLESLETVGLGGVEVGGGAALLKPLGHIRALKAGHLVHSQGTTHVLAPHVGVDVGAPCKPFSEGQGEADAQKGGPASKPRTFSSGPPSPSHKDHHNLRLGDSPTFDPSLPYILRGVPHHPQQDSRLLLPLRHPSESVRPRHIPSPLRLDMDMAGKSLLRETRSQPSSPSPLLPRDGGFHHIVTPIQTPSALSLAQSMFGVGGAFDLNDERSPKNSPRVPSASSTPPGHRLTNTSPHSSPPLSRSSSAPSSPTLRRTACLSISPSSTRVAPVVLRSSHPNLHLAAHKTPPGLHRTPPTPSSWPRHPTTPPAFPRQLKVPGGAERPREEEPSSGQAWVRARGSWPSSHVELCGCGRSRCAEVTERSPCASSSCDRVGQRSSREPPPNPHTPGGPSVSHTQAAFGTATRGLSGERETSSANSNRLKTHPLPSPTPHTGPTELAMPRKQNHIHSPILTKGCVASNPIQATVDPGLCPVLRPQPCATHSPDLNIKKDPSTFTLIKPGISHPPFLDPSENQSRDFTTAILETDRAASFGPNTVQLQGLSDCPSLRAQGFYCNYSPVDTCDRQTQTQSYEQFDLILCQTESVGHSQIVTEVQTVNAISNVAQLIPSVAQNPVQISAPCRIQTPGPNFSGTDSTVDTRLNFESLASSAFLRHDRNYSGDTLQTQDHNGNKVSLPSNVGDLGFLNCTVGSPGTLVLHDPDISQSPSVTCTHLTANPVASVTAAAVQVSATTASRAAIQGPVHTNAPGAAIQGPAHTTASRTTVQGPVHTTAPGAAVQGPVHTTASRATVQGPIHTTAPGATVQGPVHTNAPGAAVQGPVHTTASRATVQGPVHTTAPGATVQGPVHTNAPGAAVQGPVHTTASRATVQGPVHTLAPGDAVHGPVHTNAPRAAVQGSVYTNASRAAVQGSVHTTAAVQEDIRAVEIPAHLSTSEPSPQGAETTVNRSRVKPHVEGNEPKEPKPVPLSLTRNSDKAFLSLLLFIHSGSSNNMIAIDNKIEQAMDLVKTHLMMAVREEVEVLREQIKELAERNAQLERENYILRALRERD